MTIDELQQAFRIHFHDADICSINLDYAAEEAIFLIDIDLSDPEREVDLSSRLGYLKLQGLLYCIIEPPNTGGFSEEYIPGGSRLWITGDSSDFSSVKDRHAFPEPLPEGAFQHFFYASTTNSCIYVAAMSAQWEWKVE